MFLDRDGVVNEAPIREGVPRPPACMQDLRLLPDVPAACRMLRDGGFRLIVVTNQPEVARRSQSLATVQAMNDYICRALDLDAVYCCPHDDIHGCHCRKPRPGMLLRAANEYGIDLHASYMIGDRWRDIEAGTAANCTSVLIDRRYGECQAMGAAARVSNLQEAAVWILGARNSNFEQRPPAVDGEHS